MIPTLTLTHLLILTLISLLCLFIFKFLIIPYLKITSHKLAGQTTYFFPGLGYYHYLKNSLKQTGDFMAYTKGENQGTHDSKFMVTNYGKDIMFVLRDPEYIKEFLQKPMLYHKGPVFSCFKYLMGSGLLTTEGETWKRHRKIISSSFHFEFLKANINVVQSTAVEFLNKITPNDCKDFPPISKVQEITGEIVGRIFFGEHLNNYKFEEKPLTLALADIVAEIGLCAKTSLVSLLGPKALKIPFIPRYRKLLQRIRGFRQVCFDIIKDAKANPREGNDLLRSLLATQKLDEPEMALSDENIVDEFVTFFVAGMDTTGHLVGMTLYMLTQHPEYIEKLKQERESTFDKEKLVTADALNKMNLLHSLLKETLRFYSPAPAVIARVAMADHLLVDLNIKKGDIIMTELLAAPNSEKTFDDPKTFRPERWMDPNLKIDPFGFIPFSAGPRNCIGQHLALIEAKVILSEFLKRFDFKLKEGYELKMIVRFLYEPVDEPMLNLSPKS